PSGQPSAVTPAGRFLVYQTQLSIRGQGSSMPLPARLESSKRCYWLWKASGWNEWAETTSAATPAWLYWARCTRNTKNQKPKTKNQKPKTKNQKPKENIRPQAAKKDSGCCGFTRPIRASPQVKKAGSHARMTPGKDRGTGRALRSV